MKAYAKINLGLRILRQREDGYHDIDTIFHRVDVWDEICLTPSSSITMTSDKADLPTDDRNLCVQAAELLRTQYDVEAGVHIELKKNIPIGAGLGGGSSDAAATLIGLCRLWNLQPSKEELASIALRLGSDVPYFLQEGSASAAGRGEILEYFTLDLPYWIVLVYPNVHISTAWAYGEFKILRRRRMRLRRKNSPPEADAPSAQKFKKSLKSIVLENIDKPHELQQLVNNDFEQLVLQSNETVARARNELIRSGAEFVQLSGSGSSVYGLYRDEIRAHHAAGAFQKEYGVFLTPPHFQPIPFRQQ